MNYLSVCSGIEAASAAWHPLGWTPLAFSEIEPFPSAVLNHHYPTTPNLGDMTQYEQWNLSQPVDILVGGTPCQSFSVAGLRGGLSDPRGSLMLTYLEITRGFRPRWIIWENVPGVLSSGRGRDFGSFLGALGELGYGWAYRVLDARWFGVPQRRRRVFVVGCLGDPQRAASVLFERESVCRTTESGPQHRSAEHPSAPAPRAFDMLGFGQYGNGATSSTVKRRDYKDATDLVVTPDGRVRRLTPVECERLQGFPDGYTDVPFRGKPAADGNRYKALGNSMAVPCMAWIGKRIKQVSQPTNIPTT